MTTASFIYQSASNDESAFSVVIDRMLLQLLSRRNSRVVCLENGQGLQNATSLPNHLKIRASRSISCLFGTINIRDWTRERERERNFIAHRTNDKRSYDNARRESNSITSSKRARNSVECEELEFEVRRVVDFRKFGTYSGKHLKAYEIGATRRESETSVRSWERPAEETRET